VRSRAHLGAEYSDGLDSHLPSVAIGTVQEITTPSLTDAREVGQHILHSRREKDPARREDAAVRENHGEPWIDAEHPSLGHVHAVGGHLSLSSGQEFVRRNAVSGEEPMHVRRGRVPRRAGVDYRDPASRATQDEGCAQARCASADDNDVVRRSPIPGLLSLVPRSSDLLGPELLERLDSTQGSVRQGRLRTAGPTTLHGCEEG
jgi:hypothetical protein